VRITTKSNKADAKTGLLAEVGQQNAKA